jgi:phage baseplate assembly protein V
MTSWEIGTRVLNMISRVTLTKADDKPMMQEHSIEGYGGEKMTNVEHYQKYGHTHVPHPPDPGGDPQKVAEGVMVCMGGSRDHPVIIATDDRRYRVTGLQEGESMLHDDQGHQMHITRGGMTHSTPNDKTFSHRVMNDKAGTPDKPMNEQQTTKQVHSSISHNAQAISHDHPAMDSTTVGGSTHVVTPGGHQTTGPSFEMDHKEFTHYGGTAAIGVDQKSEKPVRLLTTAGPHKQAYGKP